MFDTFGIEWQVRAQHLVCRHSCMHGPRPRSRNTLPHPHLPPHLTSFLLGRRTVMERPVAEGATLHFVDDRYETLHAVAEQAPDLLQRWVPNPARG